MPTYNGYFLNVALSGGNESHVRDYDLNEQLSTKGAILTASENAGADGLAKLVKIAAGTTNQVLAMNASGMPAWGNIATIAGLKSAAFAETTDFDAAGAATTAEQSAKAYTDDKIDALGKIMRIVGTTTTAPTEGVTGEAGDVYIVSSDGTEYVKTESGTWEKLGQNSVDLTGYVAKSEVVPSVTTGLALATVGGKTIYAPAAAAQQQADWTETNTTSVTFIQNKPDLSIYAEATDLDDYVTKASVIPGITTGISLGMVGGTTIYMPSAASLSTTLGLKALAFKDNVSVPANTFVTDITATANNQDVVGVGATGASKISAFNGGAAAFAVSDGVLSLDYTAATLTYTAATTSTLATINVNNYSATKNSAMTLN